jgi:hypothetical protein
VGVIKRSQGKEGEINETGEVSSEEGCTVLYSRCPCTLKMHDLFRIIKSVVVEEKLKIEGPRLFSANSFIKWIKYYFGVRRLPAQTPSAAPQ